MCDAQLQALHYYQDSMVVINYLEQLQPGTFEHALHHLIDKKLDLSGFDPNYKNDEGGRGRYPRRFRCTSLGFQTSE